MLLSSLASWQAAHGPQHKITQQSSHMEPLIPPTLLILFLKMISPPGTHAGAQKHSPVLEAKLQTAHG